MTTKPPHRHTNNLIRATSPYLLQHAHNPVNWHEWGKEALELAKRENKPIFLSIGYAACHWCHVMEHESFEEDEVAAVLNEHFISIKVDREERPDIDEIYMAYTVQVTGSGGWPMSVWLTPDGLPFHAGTYFPKEPFLQILGAIADAWKNDRKKITDGADGAANWLRQWSAGPPKAEGVIPLEAVDKTATLLAQYFDKSLGGISGGGSNKFPPSMGMDLMLRAYHRTGAADLFEAVDVTLDHMARGGIYDHLGGGICRYSTDIEWLVPHFEKMLYDQALVSAIYLDGYLVSQNDLYARTAGDIFDYVLADLQSPEGGFYSSRDADSDGLEGAFYIWTVEQVQEVLGKEEADLFCKFYNVTKSGNWFEMRGHAPKGPKNVLRIQQPLAAFAKTHSLKADELSTKINGWRKALLAARAKRTPPALDDKVLTGWNGLMIASLAKGSRILDEPKYAASAARAADFVLAKMQENGRLLRTYRAGSARLTAYLSDYAFLIEGLLNLYEATFDRKWLKNARMLADTAVKHYFDASGGGFFFTADDAETLVARSKSPTDGAIPSGNSVMALNLLRLSVMLDRKDFLEHAESIFRAFAQRAGGSPSSFDRLLCAADFYHDKVKEIVIVGKANAADTRALVRTVFGAYHPNKVVLFTEGRESDATNPLLKGKTTKAGAATAYVCENYNCKLPTTDPAVLAKQLAAK